MHAFINIPGTDQVVQHEMLTTTKNILLNPSLTPLGKIIFLNKIRQNINHWIGDVVESKGFEWLTDHGIHGVHLPISKKKSSNSNSTTLLAGTSLKGKYLSNSPHNFIPKPTSKVGKSSWDHLKDLNIKHDELVNCLLLC